ncbi:hypothetical protein [Aliamphritea ceti]|uniref:hypothetical protein n=1 Tax=Aliamphritea ceti TaxID=1524258 RepID=UPI0021C310A1|nr:hypothetical protein [Aliamphritea ceti]
MISNSNNKSLPDFERPDNTSAALLTPLPTQLELAAELQRANTLVTAGNSLLTCSVVMLLATIFTAYVIPDQVTLQIQIISHIGMLIFATGLKFGYVLRLTGQHRIKQYHKQILQAEKLRKQDNHYGLCNA